MPDRFPVLFDRCRQEFGPTGAPRLLSFGCSTEEEVFTLARYLPAAQIVGVDLSRWCLRQCRKAPPNPNLRFLHVHSPEFAAAAGFDAIFCLAVLQRSENAVIQGHTLQTGFLFSHFAAALALLDEKLKPAGLLFLDQADFSFLDTPSPDITSRLRSPSASGIACVHSSTRTIVCGPRPTASPGSYARTRRLPLTILPNREEIMDHKCAHSCRL